MAKAVVRQNITSEWSPKNREGGGRLGAGADVNAVGVSSPAILFMFGIISSRPCDAVKSVIGPPAGARVDCPAAPPSLCISVTCGTEPQMFGTPRTTIDPPIRPCRRRRDGIDGDDFIESVGDISHRFVAVHGLELRFMEIPL